MSFAAAGEHPRDERGVRHAPECARGECAVRSRVASRQRGGIFDVMFSRAFTFAALLGVGAGSGCTANEPVASSPSSNKNVQVDTLFVHDGCTVYRFYDAGYHYYVRCAATPNEASTLSTVPCGKNCRREENVGTSLVHSEK